MAELDATLKQITAGLRFSSFQGHEAFRVLGKDDETFFVNLFVVALEEAECPPVILELPVMVSNFLSVQLLNLILGVPPDGMVSCANLLINFIFYLFFVFYTFSNIRVSIVSISIVWLQHLIDYYYVLLQKYAILTF